MGLVLAVSLPRQGVVQLPTDGAAWEKRSWRRMPPEILYGAKNHESARVCPCLRRRLWICLLERLSSCLSKLMDWFRQTASCTVRCYGDP